MKFAAVLLSAVAIVVTSTYAAECTYSQLSAIENRPEMATYESACKNVISSSSPGGEAAARKVCGDKECISALVAALKVFPDCTIQGLNPKTMYTTIEAGCKKLGLPVASPGSSSSASSGMQSSASTAASAVAMAAAVIVYGRA